MPGSSLWLLPPKSHPLHEILTTLITTTLPSKFPEIIIPPPSSPSVQAHGMDNTFFPPHMTLTSGISPTLYGSDPQTFLDSLPFPQGENVKVRFAPSSTKSTPDGNGKESTGGIQTQETFFRRCFIKVILDDTIRHLAGISRAKCVYNEDSATDPKTSEWLRTWAEEFGPHVSLVYGDIPINDETLAKISQVVEEAGVDLGRSSSADGIERYNGWDGGVVWLVPTDRPVNEWKPIAIREL